MARLTHIPRKPVGRVVSPGGRIASAVRSIPPQVPPPAAQDVDAIAADDAQDVVASDDD